MPQDAPKEAGKGKMPPKYTKAQILASARFSDRRDLLGAVLDDKGEYTLDEIDKAIKDFLKGKVK